MNIRSKNIKFGIPVIIVLAGILFSCVNDLDSVRRISLKPNDPDERTTGLELFYTDSGIAKIEVFAKLAETFSKPKQVIQFKDGLKVNFYNDEGEIFSILTALYGEIYQETGIIIVRDSVVLFNPNKKKRLLTEELIWQQKDSTIYTEKAVTIKTPEALFYGDGIRTKQDFSASDMLKPKGTINIQNK